MSNKPLPQHKRLAMGDTIKGYAKGGRIGLADSSAVGSNISAIDVRSSGKSANPLTTAKRNNGIPGYKSGGSTHAAGCGCMACGGRTRR